MSNESFLQVLIQDTGERRLLAIGLVYEFHLQHYLPGWGSPGEPTVGYHVDDGRIFDAKDPVNGRELSGTVFTLFFVYRWSSLLSNLLATVVHMFNPRSILEKLVTRSLEGGGGSIGPPPSTFDKIHPTDLKFGTYCKLHLYFQLSETTWCLIGFHGNNSQINNVTVGCHLGYSNFQILFKFSLFYLRLTGKQHLGRICCEVLSI